MGISVIIMPSVVMYNYMCISLFHLNLQYILSSGKDGSAHLWEFTSGEV